MLVKLAEKTLMCLSVRLVWKWYMCLGNPTVQIENTHLCLLCQTEHILDQTKALYHQVGTFSPSAYHQNCWQDSKADGLIHDVSALS